VSREAWIAVAVVVGIVALLTLYGAIRLLVKLVRTRRLLGELGGGGQVVFWGAILYTIFPFDLLPDPIYLDDMAVLGGALLYLTKLVRDRGGAKALLEQARKTPVAPKR
jgi:hypothetical protein